MLLHCHPPDRRRGDRDRDRGCFHESLRSSFGQGLSFVALTCEIVVVYEIVAGLALEDPK
jgi:hypothetical protein